MHYGNGIANGVPCGFHLVRSGWREFSIGDCIGHVNGRKAVVGKLADLENECPPEGRYYPLNTVRDVAGLDMLISPARLDGVVQNVEELESVVENGLGGGVLTQGVQDRRLRTNGADSVRPVRIQVGYVEALADGMRSCGACEQDERVEREMAFCEVASRRHDCDGSYGVVGRHAFATGRRLILAASVR